MAKFRNKKTNEVLEENLNFYIERLRENPNFEEIKTTSMKEKNKKKEEVAEEPLQ